MQLAVITPKALYELMDLGDALFVVAPLLVDNPGMIKFIKESPKYTILDNGVHENNLLPLDQFLDLAKQIEPDEIIVPDVLYDAEKTKRQVNEFLDYTSMTSGIMLVPQGKTALEFLDCYHWIADVIEHFGLDASIGITDREILDYSRASVWNYLVMSDGLRQESTHHFLGLHELVSLSFMKEVWRVRSIDTSMPCTFAYHEMRMEFPFAHGKTRVPLDCKGLPRYFVRKNVEYMKWYIEQLEG